MIRPPFPMGSFEFVVLATLRTAQLTRGCLPRVTGDHTRAVIAQLEISEGKVTRMPNGAVPHGPSVNDGQVATGDVTFQPETPTAWP